jgi:CRP/FNR family cyclic AMP-dependent transcriptional regulator
LKERFEGSTGRRVLLDVLMQQKLVNGNAQLAEGIADAAELRELEPGAVLIEQNADDRDVFFILAGALRVVVNGRDVNIRRDRDHVGEMAAIEPSQPRSATVVAMERSVVAHVTEAQFSELAERHPWLWRMVAKELSRRLMQRNALVTAAREKTRVFVMSSAEALPIARALQTAFEHDPFEVVVWTDGVFRASHYSIESLEMQLDRSDFAIAIAAADDETTSRDERHLAPRDNVTFELGFFMGRLGRKRTLLLEPRGEHVKLPSDLAGLTTLTYDWRPGRDAAAAIAPTANKLRDIILDLGPMA